MTISTRRPRRDGQATRAAILSAAHELFRESGYQRTTVRAIAERAGCNPALISRYFGGKARLFDAVVFADTRERVDADLLLDAPFGFWGRALVHRHVRLTAETDPGDLHDHLSMLARSAGTPDGPRMVAEFLSRLEVQPQRQQLTGPDAELRATLIQAQLVGLTVLRDVVRLPALREAPPEALANHLGPAVQSLLRPN